MTMRQPSISQYRQHAGALFGQAALLICLSLVNITTSPLLAQSSRHDQPTNQQADQPEADHPFDRSFDRRHAQTDRPQDPQQLRDRLSSMLEDLLSTAARIENALNILDQGGSQQDALDAIGGPMAVRRLSSLFTLAKQQHPFDRKPTFDRSPKHTQEQETVPHRQPVDDTKILDYLQEHAPALGHRIALLQRENPDRARAIISRFMPRYMDIQRTMHADPDLGKLLEEEFIVSLKIMGVTEELAQARNTGDEKQIETARQALLELAGRDVDLRLAQRQYELDQLVAKTNRLRSELDTQRTNREAFIERIVARAMRFRDTRKRPTSNRPGAKRDGHAKPAPTKHDRSDD